MKTRILGLVLLMAPAAALAQQLSLTQMSRVPAGVPLVSQYAAPAEKAGVDVARIQFAIIHQLTAYESQNLGGYGDFESWRARDNEILAALKSKAGIEIRVTPIPRELRAAFWDKVRVIRGDFREGKGAASRHSGQTRKPISPEELARRHRQLIGEYQDHIKVLQAGTGSSPETKPQADKPLTEASFKEQAALYDGLLKAAEAMAGAHDEAAYVAAVAAFNIAAAKYAAGVQLRGDPKDARADLQRAAAFVDLKREGLMHMDMALHGGTQPSVYQSGVLERLKAKEGGFFDGLPGAEKPQTRPGGFNNASNPEGYLPGGQKPNLTAATTPPSPEKKEHKPGFFGMLGGLLGKLLTGLFRTVSRVAGAVFKSLGLIGKALFS